MIRTSINPYVYASPVRGSAGNVAGLAIRNGDVPAPQNGIRVGERAILGRDGFTTIVRTYIVPGRGLVSTGQRIKTLHGELRPIRGYYGTK